MFWQEKGGIEYLAVKELGNDNATTKGARSQGTEARFAAFTEEKARAKQRSTDADSLIDQRARQYHALCMPAMTDGQGELLRALDVAGLQRNVQKKPMDIDFVLELPVELRDLFNDWAQQAGYTPSM